MSVEYEFYVGARDGRTGKVGVSGPFVDGKPCPFYSRSQSFIDSDAVLSRMAMVGVSEIEGEWLPFLADDSWGEDGRYYSRSYSMPLDEVLSHADYGLRKGYVTMEDMLSLAEDGFDPESVCELPMVPADVVAEMGPSDRSRYGMVAVVNTRTLGYICNLMAELVDCLRYDSPADRDYVMLCRLN